MNRIPIYDEAMRKTVQEIAAIEDKLFLDTISKGDSMHNTKVVMKDGRVRDYPMDKWRPEEGYIILMDSDEKLYFKDMVSAITANERISATKFGDEDEIERARDYMRRGREHRWGSLTPETPKQEWE